MSATLYDAPLRRRNPAQTLAEKVPGITLPPLMVDDPFYSGSGLWVRPLANGAWPITLLFLIETQRGIIVLKVLIADDHAVIRQGLRRHLTSVDDIMVVAEAATASDVLTQLEQHSCDVLLMDLTLGHASGLDVVTAVKAIRPHLPIVIFTLHEHMAYARSALQRGATGYVPKTRPLSEVVTAVRYAMKGTKYVSPPFEDVTTTMPLGLAAKPLSRRQQQILTLRGQGQHAREIGAALGITAKTVSAHEEKILEKLQLRSRHELLQYAARQIITGRQTAASSSPAPSPISPPCSRRS